MPRLQTSLYLHEEVLLLALRDEQGTVECGSHYVYAMCGGILAELLLGGRITVENNKKKLVNVVHDEPFGDPVIDECLERIVTAKRRANPQAWVQRFWHVKNLHHRVAAGLCKRGILRGDEDKVLWLFRRRIYPEINPQPERKLIERLRKAIFGEGRRVDPRTVVILSLANGADLLKIHFDKRKLRGKKKRIAQVVNGDLMGKATKEAIEAAQAAVMVACVMPAIMVATISS